MSSNFSGISKSARPFQPKGPDAPEAVIGRTVGGASEPITDFQVSKAAPIGPTTPTPQTDGLGEKELGLSGSVDHPNRDGGPAYLAGKIARVYRRLTADGAALDSLSTEQRRQLRDQLVQGVYDGDGQHPSGEAASQSQSETLAYVRRVASLLFGLADDLSGSEANDPIRVKSVADFMHKSASNAGETYVDVRCPNCTAMNVVNRTVYGGIQKIDCGHCKKSWQQDLGESHFTKSAPPEIEYLRKQLLDLSARIKSLLAARLSNTSPSGFVTKNAGSEDAARAELHKALANGKPAQFPGQDTRDVKPAGGRFQPRG